MQVLLRASLILVVLAILWTGHAYDTACHEDEDVRIGPDPIQGSPDGSGLLQVASTQNIKRNLMVLIRTGGPYSPERLDAINETWGHGLPWGPRGMIVPFETFKECTNKYNDGHGKELTCLEAKNEVGLIAKVMSHFTWLFIIDDDVYLNVDNLQHVLTTLDPDERRVWGIPGCGDCDVAGDKGGLCGGGGYLISRRNLQTMTVHKKLFLEQFNQGPDQAWCDVRFGCVAQMHGLTLTRLPGLYGWRFHSVSAEDDAVLSKTLPPLTFHYADPVRMRSLHAKLKGSAKALLQTQTHETSLAAYWSQQKEFVRKERAARFATSTP